MDLHIDKLGRIVVPKKLRERFGLTPNMQLEVVAQADGILLRVPEHRPAMVKVSGLWVHQGVAQAGMKWDSVVDEAREERHLALGRV